MRHHNYRHFLWTFAAAGAFIVGCQRSGSGDYRATADVPPPDRSSTASDTGVRMSAERTSGDTPATPATPQDSTTGGVVTERTAGAPTTVPAPAAPEAAPAAAPAPAPAPDATAVPAPAPEPATPAPFRLPKALMPPLAVRKAAIIGTVNRS